MRILLSTALLAVALPVTSFAQSSHVAPAGFGYDTGPGEGTAPRLFAPGHAREMELFDAAALGFGAGTIVEIAWRRDAGTVDYQAFQTSLTVRMAHSDVAPTTMPFRFAAVPNEAGVTVFSGALNLPAAPPGPTPHAFTARVPLSTPFSFDPTRGNLVLDAEADNPFGTGWRRDARSVFTGTPGSFRRFVDACPNSTGFQMTHRPTNLGNCAPGRVMNLWLAGTLPMSTHVAHVIGPAFPQPFDLTPIGAPGCRWAVEPLLPLPPVPVVPATTSFGYAYVSHPIPPDARLVGASIATQWFELDQPPGNTFGAIASDAIEITLGASPIAPYVVQTLWSTLRGSATGAQKDDEFGPIVRFTVR